jgi:glycopeptide antibiotics resistance protein
VWRDGLLTESVKWKLAWLASALAIAAAEILPLSNFQGHSHWAKVCWIPFSDYHTHGFWVDVCQNMMLVGPFGFAGVRAGAGRTQVVILAAILMASGELFQVYCHNRFPSMTDVTSGTLGALLGVWIRLRE